MPSSTSTSTPRFPTRRTAFPGCTGSAFAATLAAGADSWPKRRVGDSQSRRTCVQRDGLHVTVHDITRRITVCPISRHPGLLTTLERLLATGNFKILPLRIERDQSLVPQSGPVQDPDQKQLPHASVYVLDGSSLSYGAESIIERIRTQYPRARLLLIKESAKDSDVFPYLRLGVRGIVRYAEAENDLVSAVNIVAKDDVWVHRKQLVRFIDWVLSTPTYRSTLSGPGSLSRREREVLVSILDGLTNKEIASVLNISERTVKFHVSHLLQKYGAQRRADLILKQYKLWPSLA